VREYNRRGFSDLEKIFILFVVSDTKRDAALGWRSMRNGKKIKIYPNMENC